MSAAAQRGQREQTPQTPQVPAPSQRGKRKGPRAIAVVRWDADVKDQAVPVLVPVTILDDGVFYDAGVYKAKPSPMPLLVGTVYEAQDKGEILGFFTIQHQAKTQAKQNWIALGDWQGATPKMDKQLDNSRSSVEVVNGKLQEQTGANPGDSGDDRDLKKKSTTVYDESGKEMPAGTPSSPAAPMGGAGDKDSRPTLKRSPGSGSTDSTSGSGTDSGKTPKKTTDDPDRPTIKRQSPGDQGQTGSAAPETKPAASGADTATDTPASAPAADPDRPELKRGKPTGATKTPSPAAKASADQAAKTSADPNVPVMRRGGNSAAKTTKDESIPVPVRVLARGPLIGESGAGDPVLHRTRTYEAVAVSDATLQPPVTFREKMPPSQREELEAKVNALAQQEVDTYLKSIGRTREGEQPAKAKPAPKPAPRKKTPPPSNEPPKSLFAEKQFEVFDLSHRNDPVMVFSGRERTTSTGGVPAKDVYVTYVANIDVEGNPHGLYRSVTVDDRLDVSPKLQLIDAIDANGDGNGELLFRRVSDEGAVFALYRVGYDRMTEMFHGGVAD